MNNQHQAARVIHTWQKRHKNVMDYNPDWAAQNLAIDLHLAGVLAPDLPKPKRDADGAMVWKDGEVWIEDDEIAVYTDLPKSSDWMTPNEARSLAYALLAAANHAEEEE